jgi:hypothetical protein
MAGLAALPAGYFNSLTKTEYFTLELVADTNQAGFNLI